MINKKTAFYNKLELAMELGICVRTLDKLMNEGLISYLKVKNRVIFSQDDLDAFCARTRRVAFGINEESINQFSK